MRALVTGGNGFLGSHVIYELDKRGYDVIAPSSSQFDLREPRDVESMFWAIRSADAVVHCAARVGGIGANVAAPGDFFRDNVLMGMNLMDAARHAHVGKMLTVGTACMYPEFCAMPQREEDLYGGAPAPATAPYAYAKRAILEMGRAYREQFLFNAIFVIPTNLYGPRDHFDTEIGHVIPSLIKKFSENDDTVTLWGTGMPTRDFLYVTDAARGIVDALEFYDSPDPVNLGSGMDYSIAQLAEHIANEMGFTGHIVWDSSMPDGTPYRRLSTEKALKEFGWEARVPLSAGLRETIGWYRRTA